MWFSRKQESRETDYATLYARPWASPIFNNSRSFWDESYGIPLESHPAGKIIVFGFPKSGNAWLTALLIDYFGMPPVEPLFDVDKSGIGQTHRPFDEHLGNRADFLHGACIVRDLRDVVASYYAYSRTERFRRNRPEFHFDDLRSFYFDWFLSRAAPAHKLMIHSEQFARLGVPIVRYEALRKDTTAELTRLLLRWGFKPDAEKVRHSVNANLIETLRFTGKMLDNMVAPDHFRRGGIGTYKEELPPDIIADIEDRFARVLRRWGYLAPPRNLEQSAQLPTETAVGRGSS